MVSRKDIENELGKGINIYPLHNKNIKGNSTNFTIGKNACSLGSGKIIKNTNGKWIMAPEIDNGRKIVDIKPGKSAIIHDGKNYNKLILLPHTTTMVETVCLLSHKSPDSHINVTVEFGEGEGKVPLDKIVERAKQHQPAPKATYKLIQEYVEMKYGFKVHNAYIAEVKRELGLPMYDAPNAAEGLKQTRKHPTQEKVNAIKDALNYYNLI